MDHTHRRDVTHILSKVSCFFYWNPFIFVGYRNDRFFSPYKSLYFECYATMLMFTDTHISSLGNVGRTIWRLQKLILGFKGASSSVVSCVKILWMQFVGNYILAINTDYIQMILHMNTSKCVRGGTPVIYLWTLGFYFTISITGLLSSCTAKHW